MRDKMDTNEIVTMLGGLEYGRVWYSAMDGQMG